MTAGHSSVRSARRERIVDAARVAFARHGYRALTMERLAQDIGIAKATLYSYYPDKPSVFAAVVAAVAADLEAAFLDELAKQGTVGERAEAALLAKHHLIFDLVRRSDHARDLFDAKDALAGQTFRDLDSRLLQAFADHFAETHDDAAELATTLFNASQGIANGADSYEQLRGRISRLVRLMTQARPEDAPL